METDYNVVFHPLFHSAVIAFLSSNAAGVFLLVIFLVVHACSTYQLLS